MEHRQPLSANSQQKPGPTQRAVSGGNYGLAQQARQRPISTTRLNNLRSISQPLNVVDLTPDGSKSAAGNAAAFLENKERMVSSPDVIKLEDEDTEPSAKRAKTAGPDFRAEANNVASEQDNADEVLPGSPLPSLTQPKLSTAKKYASFRRSRLGIEPTARKANGRDPPSAAPRIPTSRKGLDFLPWTGHHPEDALNDTVVKNGFFDKPSTANQECNSAKTTVWPGLSHKNGGGLSLLGYLYTAVMEKRQTNGKCTSPSTFKPPPRVTVTDTKREAWLRDLANPDVPLRKQSRTIPHGIRGKLLMDQCLSKTIPLQRAVWLAKCVGANELRAFRRKGVTGSSAASSESKWINEWTIHVEQFLESVIVTAGQQGWQQKMNYAVRLTTALFTEKLLDNEHYLDWIVTSLTQATMDSLPTWIVLVQVYWKYIVSFVRRGRKMAEGMLEHLHRLTEAEVDACSPLKTRLQRLMAVLAVSNRGCIVIPQTWEKYKYLLKPRNEDIKDETPADSIAKRNERFAEAFSKSTMSARSPVLELYGELDAVSLHVDVEGLSKKCLGFVSDTSKLISALLDWASTRFRVGTRRVYLTARIIAHLQKSGWDTDGSILRYLGESKTTCAAEIELVHRVIVHACQLEAFSVSRYLQWLITSGALARGKESTLANSLVAALPTTGLPSQMLNIQKTLMLRLGLPTDERATIYNALDHIEHAVSGSVTTLAEPISIPDDLTLSARLHLCQQACHIISVSSKAATLSLEAFAGARQLIERTRDVSILASLVEASMATDDAFLFATIVDTTNLHAETLAATGDLARLVDGLKEQYLLLRTQQTPERTAILSLTSLAQRIPDQVPLLKLLENDLAICEQLNSPAVCSPASDSLIGMQATNLDSDEDIDAVFASGNMMDDHLMQRVFDRILQRASRTSKPDSGPVSRVGRWLEQLRAADASGIFDNLIVSHLKNALRTGRGIQAPEIVALVACGSISLSAVAGFLEDIVPSHTAEVILHLLLTADQPFNGLHDCEKYRYRLQQERCQADHSDIINAIVQIACGSRDLNAEQSDLVRFTIRNMTHPREQYRTRFGEGTDLDTWHANADRIYMAVLEPDSSGRGDRNDLGLQLAVKLASPLSINFCQRVLDYHVHTSQSSSADETALKDAILNAFANDVEVWPQLLEAAGRNVNAALRDWAQGQLLQVSSTIDNARIEDKSVGMQSILRLLSLSSRQAGSKDDARSVSTIAERLRHVESKLTDRGSHFLDSQEAPTDQVYPLQILLHLCVLHVCCGPDDSETLIHARCDMLSTMCRLLVHHSLQTDRDLVDSLFDLSSILSDNLASLSEPPPMADLLGKLPQDPRLHSIFGSDPLSPGSWLALVSQIQPPNQQPHRNLSRQPSQQQYASNRPGQTSLNPQAAHHRMPSQNITSIVKQDSKMPLETKTTAFHLRHWEVMPDPTPVQGENDASLSLALFGARKV